LAAVNSIADRVGVLRRPDVRGDEATGRLHAVERAAVDDEVLDHRERVGAPRLDVDLVAVLEQPHVQLARGGRALAAVRAPVDHQRAHAADALAAVVIERDGLLALVGELLVEDVEHLEERRVRGHVRDLVGHELAGGLAIRLAPDMKREADRFAHL